MDMALDSGQSASDEELLERYAAGDQEAARLLTLRLAPGSLALARRMLGPTAAAEAEDVTQEAMLRLWRQAPHWQSGGAKPSTWLYRVTANLCLDRLRRRGRTVPLGESDEPADERQPVAVGMMERERAAALERALQALPDRQRQAVILRHIEGLANPEIAEIMEIGVEAVESLTARARRALKAQLAGRKQELGFEDD